MNGRYRSRLKIPAVLAVSSLSLGLGCGDDSNGGTTSSSTTTATTTAGSTGTGSTGTGSTGTGSTGTGSTGPSSTGMGTGSTGTVGELNCNTAANDDETVCNAEPYCAWYPLEIGETETGTIVTGYCDVDCAALPNTSSCEAQECCYLSGSDCLYDAGFCQPI